MGSSGLVKRVAGLVVVSLLMPGGIPLALAALVAGRIWRAGSPG
jgi:hypothetical protein